MRYVIEYSKALPSENLVKALNSMIYFENIHEDFMSENLPNLKKTRYLDTGSREGPKQVESKQAHTKTQYN